MRIVRNVGHVRRRSRLARWSALVGFLCLASTFSLIFFPKYVILAYLVLFPGFLLFNFGMQQMGKWSNNARKLRDDVALDNALSSLSDRYVMLHYCKLGKDVIEHQLIHPGGVLVITTRDLPGRVEWRGGRWRRKGAGFTRLFGMSGPQLGNPSGETTRSLAVLDRALSEGQMELDTAGAIVFTSPLVDLDSGDSEYPAMKLDQILDFVRRLEPDTSFKNADRDAVVALLAKGEALERSEPSRTRRPVRVKRRPARASTSEPS
jgi:hypothetical protein